MCATSIVEAKICKILDSIQDIIERGINGPEVTNWVFACCGYQRFGNDLAKLGESAVDALIKYAGRSNLDQRICIFMALGRIGSEKSVSLLVEALQSEFWIEREYAARAIARIADPSALDALKKGLERETVIRSTFYSAINSMADETTKEVFRKALEDEDPSIRRIAVKHFAATPGAGVLPILLDALHDKQMGVVFDAVRGLKLYGDQILDDLVAKLTASGPYARMAAVQLLGNTKSPRAVEPLCEQLEQSKNKSLRADIAWALGKIKSEKAVKTLCRALKDPAGEVRKNAAEALGKIASIEAVTDLEDLLYSQKCGYNDVAQSHAITAIGKIRSPEAVKALQKALHHDDNEVRAIAVDGLRKQKAVDTIPSIQKALSAEKSDSVIKAYEKTLYELRKAKSVMKSKKATNKDKTSLIDPVGDLKNEDPSIRSKAIAEIKKSDFNGKIACLEPMLLDEDAKVRQGAAAALTELKAEKVIPDLIKQLEEANGVDLPSVIEALGVLGDRSIIEVILPYMAHDANHIRRSAKTALKRLNIPGSRLREKELEVSINDLLKMKAYDRITKLGTPAIPILQKIMVDMSHTHQMDAAFALYRMDWRPETVEEKVCYYARISSQQELDAVAEQGFEVLAKLYDKGEQPDIVAKALAATGSKGIAYIIRENHRYFSPASANPVVGALVAHGKDHIDLIIESFKDKSLTAERKGYLAQALGMMASSKAVDPLIAFLKDGLQLSDMKDDLCYYATCRALGQIGSKSAVPCLTDALNSDYPWRRGAAAALGEIGSKEAIFALRNALRQSDANVKAKAAAALQKIGFEPQGEREKGLQALAGNDFDTLAKYAMHVTLELIKRTETGFAHTRLVEILGTLEGDDVMRALAKLLGSSGNSERKAAHKALANFGSKAYPFLIEAVQSPRSNSQREAAILLGQLKNSDAADYLIPLLKAEYEGTVKAAADALGKIKAEKAARPLLAVLPHENSALVRSVLTALGKIKSLEAVEPLKDLVLSEPRLEKLRLDTIVKIEKANR